MYRCLYQGIGKYRYRQVVYIRQIQIFYRPSFETYSTILLYEKTDTTLRIVFVKLFPSFLVVCEFHFPTEMAI